MRVPRLTVVVVLLVLLTGAQAPVATPQDRRGAVPPSGWLKAERRHASDVREARVAQRRAWRFTVHPGDRPVRSGERTELVATPERTGAFEGARRTYRWSVLFPQDLNPVPDSTWNLFTQWHGSAADGCHPNLALQVNTKKSPAMLRLQVRGGPLTGCEPAASRSWDFAPVRLGTWNDFTLRVTWSASGDGAVALEHNGVVVVPPTATPTLYPGESAYLKQGFYRGPASALTSTIFQTTPAITAR